MPRRRFGQGRNEFYGDTFVLAEVSKSLFEKFEPVEISDGAMASEAYFTMESLVDPAELSRLRAALLEYCKQDTLGLVRLLEKMRAMEAADAKG